MKKILICLASLIITQFAHSAAVTIGTGGARGHQFLTSNTETPTRVSIASSSVRIGYLTTSGDSSTFQVFGNSAISNPISSATIGGFVSTATSDNPAAGSNPALSVIAGRQLAIWVTAQNGDQGLFTSTSWVVPSTLGTASDQLYNLILGSPQGTPPPTVTAVPITGFNNASVSVGTITVTTSSNTNGTTYVLGAAVPEPSVLSLLAVLGAMSFRRRR
jgi:hypothetical protein